VKYKTKAGLAGKADSFIFSFLANLKAVLNFLILILLFLNFSHERGFSFLFSGSILPQPPESVYLVGLGYSRCSVNLDL
jgi:hypothetical protein